MSGPAGRRRVRLHDLLRGRLRHRGRLSLVGARRRLPSGSELRRGSPRRVPRRRARRRRGAPAAPGAGQLLHRRPARRGRGSAAAGDPRPRSLRPAVPQLHPREHAGHPGRPGRGAPRAGRLQAPSRGSLWTRGDRLHGAGRLRPRLPGRTEAAGGSVGGGLPLRPHPELAAGQPRAGSADAALLVRRRRIPGAAGDLRPRVARQHPHRPALGGGLASGPALGLPGADPRHRPRGLRGLRARHRARPRRGAAHLLPLLPSLVDPPDRPRRRADRPAAGPRASRRPDPGVVRRRLSASGGRSRGWPMRPRGSPIIHHEAHSRHPRR